MSGTHASPPQLPLTEELAGVSARIARLLLSAETVESTLGALSVLAWETTPGSSGAGVSLIDEQRRTSSGSTDELVREADRLQYELGEGPCLAAAESRRLVRIDDLAGERRWPRWAEAAAALGLGSAMSSPLVAGDVSMGAIKVYAREPRAFDVRSEQRLTLFAAQAAVLVGNMRHHERAGRMSAGFREAVHGRDLVNVAKGVLMGRHAVDEDTAYGLLLAQAQERADSLSQTARAVVDSAVRRRR